MNELQQNLFDYEALNPVIAVEARSAAERIKIRMKRTAEDIVEIGRDLIAVKEKLPHGEFGKWIEAEFEMSYQASVKIMQVARKFEGKYINIIDLKPNILYQLAAPSTPDEVTEKAIDKAKNGEKVTTKDVDEWKLKAQESEKRSEEWRQQAIETRRKAEEIELQSLNLKKEIESLQQAETVTVEKEVIKEIIPKGYKTIKDAVTAKQKELEEKKDQLRQLANELLEKQQRRNAETELQRKRGLLMVFKSKLSKLLSETEDNQLVIASETMSPEIDAELLAIEERLLLVVEKIRKARSTDSVLVGELV